jgi:hypothetical protein
LPGGSGFTAFHKLDTAHGSITDFGSIEDAGGNQNDAYIRVLLSPDGSKVYVNENGNAWMLNTGDDSYGEALQVVNDGGSVDLAMSGDGSAVMTSNFLTDANLNALTQVAYVDREVWLPLAFYGEKLNSNGTQLYQPTTNGIDVLNGTTGLLQYRVALPFVAANVYDTLTVDGTDGSLFLITASGIERVSLSDLPQSTSKVFGNHSITSGRGHFIRSTAAPRKRGVRRDSLGRLVLRYQTFDGIPIKKSQDQRK